ncbi:copper chaperone PCu(A)C, partial [Alphaproteobacteria bacterium]|nr:copper chaperone PCu(A)C [Alphaproteobacteria bacterium]
MRLKFLSFFLNLLIFVTCISSGYANSINIKGLLISDFWIKATIGKHKMTSGYLTIENTNNIDERLVSLTSEISKKTQIHDMVVQNDIMKMKHLSDGILIKAKSTVSFRPGSYHIMFMELNKHLVEMNKYQVT